ncbi:MAG: hypothetical protein LQ348_003024 [Seirophora lacunosa]|nr:MAG: hypothetical protein LQ348_003024 [Seirophora lacunosa]
MEVKSPIASSADGQSGVREDAALSVSSAPFESLRDLSAPHKTFGVARGPPPPPNLSIQPITPSTVPSFRRIISLLLPIRYPDKFFAESVANTTPSSLARVALWHERPRPAKRKREENPNESPQASATPASESSGTASSQLELNPGTVIGGIQCRMEQLPFHPSLLASPKHPTPAISGNRNYCYIQTLALLSPYRAKGIATALVETIITTLCTEKEYEGTASMYAHVWEANEEALEWYVKRRFQVGDVVQGYYRRLKPAGARIVWRDLEVGDYLKVQSGQR